MSHFSVLVIGDHASKQLAPYHEFECTGVDDEFVQAIDDTEEARQRYEESTTQRYREPSEQFPLGILHDPFQDRFYRDPTEEEIAKHGPFMGIGFGMGLSFTSKDWGDGKGYRAKVHFLPEGWEEVSVPTKDIKTFAEYVSDYYGRKTILEGETPDLANKHKYGYTVVKQDGSVVKTVGRTNPNKKWDWWQIGGRFSGRFKLKPKWIGAGTIGRPGTLASLDPDYKKPGKDRADVCNKGWIDFEAMRNEAAQEAAERYDLFSSVTAKHAPIVPWNEVIAKHTEGETTDWDKARKEYRAQPGVVALRENKETVWLEPDDFKCTREEYIDRARKSAISSFAVVKDGQWYERGNMGWWGVVTDEKDRNEWNEQFHKLIDGLPDDTLLTIVDCHI